MSTTISSINIACNKRLAALEKLAKSKNQIVINGVTHKASDLIAVYQAAIDAQEAASTAQSEAKIALAARDVAVAAYASVDPGLRTWVENTFGIGSRTARDFGFEPRKVGKKSVATKMQAIEKSRATRKGANDNGSAPAQPSAGGGSNTSNT